MRKLLPWLSLLTLLLIGCSGPVDKVRSRMHELHENLNLGELSTNEKSRQMRVLGRAHAASNLCSPTARLAIADGYPTLKGRDQIQASLYSAMFHSTHVEVKFENMLFKAVELPGQEKPGVEVTLDAHAKLTGKLTHEQGGRYVLLWSEREGKWLLDSAILLPKEE